MLLDDLLDFRVLLALHGTMAIFTAKLTDTIDFGGMHLDTCVRLDLLRFTRVPEHVLVACPVLDTHDHLVHGHAIRVHGLFHMIGNIGTNEPLTDVDHENFIRHTVQLEAGIQHCVQVVHYIGALRVGQCFEKRGTDRSHVHPGTEPFCSTMLFEEDEEQIVATWRLETRVRQFDRWGCIVHDDTMNG